jgi:hypothetical protein
VTSDGVMAAMPWRPETWIPQGHCAIIAEIRRDGMCWERERVLHQGARTVTLFATKRSPSSCGAISTGAPPSAISGPLRGDPRERVQRSSSYSSVDSNHRRSPRRSLFRGGKPAGEDCHESWDDLAALPRSVPVRLHPDLIRLGCRDATPVGDSTCAWPRGQPSLRTRRSC